MPAFVVPEPVWRRPRERAGPVRNPPFHRLVIGSRLPLRAAEIVPATTPTTPAITTALAAVAALPVVDVLGGRVPLRRRLGPILRRCSGVVRLGHRGLGRETTAVSTAVPATTEAAAVTAVAATEAAAIRAAEATRATGASRAGAARSARARAGPPRTAAETTGTPWATGTAEARPIGPGTAGRTTEAGATAAGSRRPFQRFLHRQPATAVHPAVDRGDRLFRLRIGAELHEGEAARATRLPIGDDVDVRNRSAALGEHRPNVFGGSGERQIPAIEPLAHAAQAPALPRRFLDQSHPFALPRRFQALQGPGTTAWFHATGYMRQMNAS